ncbi:MAG: AMP-binding protein [Clostridia bacterium]|nr:AMP-binding protein [Clostridia bacterium]
MKVKALREKREFANIREMVEDIGERFSGKVAYRYRVKPHDKEVVKVTYDEMRDHVRALATEIIARGYQGKKIAVIGKHTYPLIQSYYATMATGSVWVPLDRDWPKEDLLETVRSGECDLLMCDVDIAEKGQFITENLELPAPIYLNGEGEDSLLAWREAGAVKFAQDSSLYYGTEIDIDALAELVFTSGTTGQGKGVMLSQRNFMSDLDDVIPFIDFSVRCMNVLPPHHTYASSVSIYGQNSIGCDIYISSGVKYILKELAEHKPGHLVAVPLYVETFYRRIVKGIDEKGKFVGGIVKGLISFNRGCHKIGLKPFDGLFKKMILSKFGGELNTIISGGAPLNQEMADLFAGLGVKVLNGYGITECAPILAVNHNNYIVPKSVGHVLPIVECRIADADDSGEGEIQVKGSNVMLGYYKNDEANAEAFTEDGFFRTGDAGRMEITKEGDRILYITGRFKNIIILSNGKNVYPEEIEDALSATPGLVDIVVYEGKSRRGIEHNAIVAEIYPDKTILEEKGITDPKAYFQKFVNEYNKTAVPYKKIGLVKVREEEFPKNTLRKILRRKMDMTID